MQLIKDFQFATSYPPEDRLLIEPEQLTAIVRNLASSIAVAREKAIQKKEDELM